ncbi:MAG: M15 family metallopeptidase [Erysipelotrichaceae bacterium]|nr:M15 family metallopeptidase [Erysipelotrichaceae bacterium]
MKKLLIVLCALLLCGCATKQYKDLGYSAEEARKIVSLKEDSQAYFSEYSDTLAALLNDEGFREDKLKTYFKYLDIFSTGQLIELANDEVITLDNYDRVKNLTELDEFMIDNIREYLKLTPRFDDEILVYLVNNDMMDSYEKVMKLASDPMFTLDNLDIYLEHFDEKSNIRDLIEYINSKAYLPFYTDEERADVEKYGYYVLVNKYYKLDADYAPDDLVNVESKYGRGKFRKDAYEAYKKMQDDAAADGIYFYIISPYRSYDHQYSLYHRYLANDTQANVDTYSARPGNSEHQLGLAADIMSSGYDFGTFYMAPAAKWLQDNAYKYGFIFRYPESKIDITGYKYEPWHYRYVGDIAEDVYKSGVTYDEYFEKYIK